MASVGLCSLAVISIIDYVNVQEGAYIFNDDGDVDWSSPNGWSNLSKKDTAILFIVSDTIPLIL